ncbi:hypothetical protein XELAEV_18034441mg [Xenopus laevis]|uniref:Uncharacterized protein n=1 Tax=Xenopus laevis TaxID=8355 RepID=A0A974HBJ7_XENLA|nr:hypothetical protein XELAEV_18034441mg [Xenopus laevis]
MKPLFLLPPLFWGCALNLSPWNTLAQIVLSVPSWTLAVLFFSQTLFKLWIFSAGAGKQENNPKASSILPFKPIHLAHFVQQGKVNPATFQ